MMRISKPADWRDSDEVTPKELYFNRRKFLTGIPGAALGAGGLLFASGRCGDPRQAAKCRQEPAEHPGEKETPTRTPPPTTTSTSSAPARRSVEERAELQDLAMGRFGGR